MFESSSMIQQFPDKKLSKTHKIKHPAGFNDYDKKLNSIEKILTLMFPREKTHISYFQFFHQQKTNNGLPSPSDLLCYLV